MTDIKPTVAEDAADEQEATWVCRGYKDETGREVQTGFLPDGSIGIRFCRPSKDGDLDDTGLPKPMAVTAQEDGLMVTTLRLSPEAAHMLEVVLRDCRESGNLALAT